VSLVAVAVAECPGCVLFAAALAAEFVAAMLPVRAHSSGGRDCDPRSDRPASMEDRDQALPRLPTVGVRFRF